VPLYPEVLYTQTADKAGIMKANLSSVNNTKSDNDVSLGVDKKLNRVPMS
jgi:hypothetical protein